MKNYFLMLFCATCTFLNAQSYFVSSNAHSLIDSYRDLVMQTNTKSCTYDNGQLKGSYYCTFNAMSAKGYNAGAAGFVSFSAWYWYTHTESKYTTAFHSAWFSSEIQENAVICKDCWHHPLVNPFPATANMDNHVFEAILVPVKAYQQGRMNASTFAHAEDATNPFAAIQIKASDVAKIYDVSIEGAGGYMSLNVATTYNNVYSSVGLVCDVLLKNGKTMKCYVFNNYDASGTMIWKGKKS